MSYLDEVARAVYSAVHGREMPAEERPLYLGYAVLVLSLGADTTADHVHNAWAAWASVACPDHDCLRPYAELAAVIQARDEPYVRAIHEVAVARAVRPEPLRSAVHRGRGQ
jgi:hypothetical protein